MFQCPKCSTEFDELPAFCGVCGASLEKLKIDLEAIDADSKAPEEASSEPDPVIGMIIGGRYRILSLLGKGGMGAVYRAEHVKMGKVVAIKLMSEQLLSKERGAAKRFEREAEMVSKLAAVNTVQVFDFGSDSGTMYLAMEFLEGRDLAAVIADEGPLPFVRAAKILMQAADALSEAHEKGIIHRDLKPANIFIQKQGEETDFVKVLDFGVAFLKNIQRTRITKQGTLVGTPNYMAPEYISGKPIDGRADLYALGAVLYKMITGITPFEAPSFMATITRHLTDPPPCPSESAPSLNIPKEADAFCAKAMAKEPADRFASAAELKQALKQAVFSLEAGSEVSAVSGETPTSTDGPSGTVSLKPRKKRAGFPDESSAESEDTADVQGATGKGNRTGNWEISQNGPGNKRRRLRTVGVVVGIAAVVFVVAGLILRQVSRNDSSREREPNDAAASATLLREGVALTGRIDIGAGQSDVDWYNVSCPTSPCAVSASITPVPGVDLSLQLVNPTSQTVIASADAGGPGEGENLFATGAAISTVYLVVRALPSLGAALSSDVPYTLTHRCYAFGGLELEPNNVPDQATVIQKGTTMGQLEGRDTDWFVVPKDTGTIQISSAPGFDVALAVGHPSAGAPKVIDLKGEGMGEEVTLSPSEAPVFFSVFEGKPSASRSTRTYRIDVR